jgi:hypothetical protein
LREDLGVLRCFCACFVPAPVVEVLLEGSSREQGSSAVVVGVIKAERGGSGLDVCYHGVGCSPCCAAEEGEGRRERDLAMPAGIFQFFFPRKFHQFLTLIWLKMTQLSNRKVNFYKKKSGMTPKGFVGTFVKGGGWRNRGLVPQPTETVASLPAERRRDFTGPIQARPGRRAWRVLATSPGRLTPSVVEVVSYRVLLRGCP